MKRASVAPFAALAVALAFLGSCAGGPDSSSAGKAGAAPRRGAPGAVVAVFDFQLKGGDSATWGGLRSDVPEALTEAFIKGGILRPVERSQLEKAIGEQELGLSGLVDESTAARLSCRLIDVETAEIVYAESVVGDAAKVFDLAADLEEAVQEEYSE